MSYDAWFGRLEAATTEAELFATLASEQPPDTELEQAQVRGRLVQLLRQRAKEWAAGFTAAGTADAWLRNGTAPGAQLQGQAFVLEETDPWPGPVGGAALLDEVAALFAEYVHAGQAQLDALALWAVYTHLFDCFGVSPLLEITSPTHRCGKSSVIVVVRHLCPRPILSGNITPAALFRAVQAWQPTLLIDEADTFAKMSDELRGILNAGHTRDTAYTVRAEGDANEPRLFSTWAPKAVAAIGRLPATIEDRAVRVPLARKPTEVQKRDAFDSEAVAAVCLPVRRRMARFATDAMDVVATATPGRPVGMNDRAWNNWRPLLAVAAAAGPEWLGRAAAAALALGSDEDGVAEDVKTLALLHVREAMGEAKGIATADALDYLVAKEEGPWAKWWEPQLAKGERRGPAARLAGLLRDFGIKPTQVWLDGQNVRGYSAEDFDAAAAAYLQPGEGIPSNPGMLGPSGMLGDTPANDAGSSISSIPSIPAGAGDGTPQDADGFPF